MRTDLSSILANQLIKIKNIVLQWKPLNVITLGQRETDIINRVITLTKQALSLVDCKNYKLALNNFNLLITLHNENINCDHIKRLPLNY
jgi:hypothetical protein